VGGTQRIETTGQATTTKKGAKAAPKKPASKGSGSPNEPSGPGAGGATPPGRWISASNWQNHGRGRRRALVAISFSVLSRVLKQAVPGANRVGVILNPEKW